MAKNPEHFYRGFIIECDDEFGYIVKNGVRELLECETLADAKEAIDCIVNDTDEFYNKNGKDRLLGKG